LTQAPTGIDWTTLTPWDDATPAQNQAEIWNLCARATSKVDNYCNQVLRATIDTELLHGPDFKVTSGPGAGGSYPTPYWGNAGFNARLVLSRWPVLEVTNVQTCPNSVWPRQWTAIPSGYYEPEVPAIGLYGSATPGGAAQGGQAIIVGGGYINWSLGRNGWVIQVTYVNGWPHSGLTSGASLGSTSLSVDDVTGWYNGALLEGAIGRIYDPTPPGGGNETIQVIGVSATGTVAGAPAGPGSLTLATGLTYPHTAGPLVSALGTGHHIAENQITQVAFH
jgi:hypothetical protein